MRSIELALEEADGMRAQEGTLFKCSSARLVVVSYFAAKGLVLMCSYLYWIRGS